MFRADGTFVLFVPPRPVQMITIRKLLCQLNQHVKKNVPGVPGKPGFFLSIANIVRFFKINTGKEVFLSYIIFFTRYTW